MDFPHRRLIYADEFRHAIGETVWVDTPKKSFMPHALFGQSEYMHRGFIPLTALMTLPSRASLTFHYPIDASGLENASTKASLNPGILDKRLNRGLSGASSRMGKRIVVTGGSGQAGRSIVSYLLDQGHEILNLDLAPMPGSLSQQVHSMRVDLSDSGQVFSALSSPFKLTQPFREPLLRPPDAVIHLAGYARNMLAPDSETLKVNVVSTHNILEAACKLGVKKIILASSICVYGVTYAQGDVDFPSFPVDEDLDTNPTDVYSISKVCGEKIARGYAKKYGIDVYVLRIGGLVSPDDYATVFAEYVNHPSKWKVHGWSFTDARDLGQMCDLGVKVDGLGFQVFNATNDENTTMMDTAELLSKECPNVPVTRQLSPREAPICNRKIQSLLGFKQQHNWKDHYSRESWTGTDSISTLS